MTGLRNQLSGKGRWLWPAITAVAVAIAVMSIVAARPGGGDRDGDGRRGHDDDCARMAELVGAADCAALETAMADGQSLADVAESNGVARQTVIDGIVAAIGAELDEAVESGELTEAQADRYREGIAAKAAGWVDRSVNERRFSGDYDHGRRGHGGPDFDDCARMAELVGAADCAALETAMADGQSLADVAEANGVARQTVIDGIVAAVNAEIDAAVEAGKLTAAQADRYRDGIAAKAAGWVDHSMDERRFGGDRGMRGHAGLDAEDCDGMAELVGAADCQTLMESLASGDTLAEIAEANGVAPQTVIDTLVARMDEELDAKVASGDLTEAKASAIRAMLSEQIAGFVNDGFEGMRHGRGGFEGAERGHGKRGGGWAW